jgi:hypothetical protein
MTTIAFQVSPTEFNVFVCLKDDNLARIRAYDPAEIDAAKFLPYASLKMRTVIVGYATDAEEAELQHAPQKDVPGLLEKLSRGFAFKPESGDSDLPYEEVQKQK